MKKEGFSSIEFLITLFFLSALLLAFIFFIKTADLAIAKKTDSIKQRESIDRILQDIYSDLKSDTTPDADSKTDRIWRWNDIEIDGYKTYISSLSGRINLNMIGEDVLKESGLRLFFDDTDGITYICENRQNGKITYSYENLKEFITEDSFNKYFTLKGFANLNISDENIIGIICDTVTKSAYGNIINDKIKQTRKNRQYIQNDTELKMILGVYYDDIFPYVNIQPQINVNFIEEEILRALLSYPGFNLTNKNSRIDALISLRDSKELTEADICNILGISKNEELYYYLGCKTLFWQIDVIGKDSACSVIVGRSYETDSSGGVKYYVIEKKWL